jgi:hypothetical protein
MQLVMLLPIGSPLIYVTVKIAHITRSKVTTHLQTEIAVVTRGSPLPVGLANDFYGAQRHAAQSTKISSSAPYHADVRQ